MRKIKNFTFLVVFFITALFSPVKGQTDWQKDSIEVIQLYEEGEDAFWKMVDMDKHREIYQRVKTLTSDLLKVKFDSVIYYNYAHSFQGFGSNYAQLGDLENAILNYDSCLYYYKEQFGSYYFPSQESLVGQAGNYANKGDYDKALLFFKQYWRVIDAHAGRSDYIDNLRNYNHGVALIYERMGKLDKASFHYLKAIDLMTKADREVRAVSDLDRIGVFYWEDKEFEKAASIFKQIKEIIQRKIPNYPIPNLYADMRMAAAYLYQRKDSLAISYIEKIFPIPPFDKIKSRQHLSIGSGLEWIGNAYFHRADYSEAIDLWRQKQVLINYYHSPIHTESTNIQQKINDAWIKLGELDSADIEIQNALTTILPDFDITNPEYNSLKAHLAIGFILPDFLGQYGEVQRLRFNQSGQLSNLQQSLKYYYLSAQMVDGIRKMFYTSGSKQILISRAIELYEGAVETALQLYEVTKEPQHLETAFSFAEKSKSVLLLESIQGNKAHSFAGVPKNLIEQEKDLKIDLAFYSKQLYDEQNKKKIDNNKITLWGNRSLQLRNEYDSLLTVFQHQYPNYFQLKYEIQYADVKEIQDYLSNDQTACIEYFWGKESLYAFLITKDKVNCIRKPLSEEMNSHLEAFTTLLSRPDLGSPETYAEHAGYLYDFLLADALKDTEVEHLIIIPDGRLGYIPFQVLIDNRQLEGVDDYRKLPYVINNYEVRYEYSSTLLLAENTPKESGKGFLGFAPKYGESESGISVRSVVEEDLLSEIGESAMLHLAPLHFTQTEVENINNLFSGQSHTGELATEATFKKEAANHSILHLAMHAHTSDENPMYSRLIFQQGDTTSIEDGMLHAYELYNMDLQAELAVLSACDTGTGQLKHGEGIMSLSRAFKYAGCPNIVMSLWQADDKSTKDIMVHFYENLKQGEGKSEALRKAKKQYLKTAEKDKSHPFYWATFVLAGDDDAVRFNK